LTQDGGGGYDGDGGVAGQSHTTIHRGDKTMSVKQGQTGAGPVTEPKRGSARALLSRGRLSLSFAWYDLWVGLYIDPVKGTIYICPLPTILITWRRKG